MFDAYSQSSMYVRCVAFSHSKTPTTWPDVVRWNRDTDTEGHLYQVFSESALSRFVTNLSAHFQHWQRILRRQPVKRTRVYRHYLPVKRHSLVHR